jgi:hypothetical protein
MAVMMQKGEVRNVGIEVTSPTSDAFTIDTADYKVYNINDKERTTPVQEGTIPQGSIQIQGRKILVLFSASVRGSYVVEITYRISPEILKADVMVVVR